MKCPLIVRKQVDMGFVCSGNFELNIKLPFIRAARGNFRYGKKRRRGHVKFHFCLLTLLDGRV